MNNMKKWGVRERVNDFYVSQRSLEVERFRWTMRVRPARGHFETIL